MATRLGKLRHQQNRKCKKERRTDPHESSAKRSDIRVAYDAPGELKMSQVLLKLVGPELDTCQGPDKLVKLERLLMLGAMAWNLSFVNPVQRETVIEELLLKTPGVALEDVQACVEPMIRRKEQMFPNARRPILNSEVIRGPGDRVHVNVLSGAVAV